MHLPLICLSLSLVTAAHAHSSLPKLTPFILETLQEALCVHKSNALHFMYLLPCLPVIWRRNMTGIDVYRRWLCEDLAENYLIHQKIFAALSSLETLTHHRDCYRQKLTELVQFDICDNLNVYSTGLSLTLHDCLLGKFAHSGDCVRELTGDASTPFHRQLWLSCSMSKVPQLVNNDFCFTLPVDPGETLDAFTTCLARAAVRSTDPEISSFLHEWGALSYEEKINYQDKATNQDTQEGGKEEL